MLKSVFDPGSVKKYCVTGFFKNITVNPVHAKTKRTNKTWPGLLRFQRV
ncbi:MAG: hypothetical protein IH947_13685 [Bacteroidetes bacterium]|nr:hypothetical protein [Bacteroidota bacterium]